MPNVTDSLFFAIFPDPVAATQMAELALKLRGLYSPRARAASRDRLHLTLHYVGGFVDGVPDSVTTAAIEAADAVCQGVKPPVEIRLERACRFRRNRPGPVVLRADGEQGVESLLAFNSSIVDALRRSGLVETPDETYVPHVTLLRERRGDTEFQVIDQTVDPIGWTVSEFFLIHSILRQGRYETLGHWSLPDQ